MAGITGDNKQTRIVVGKVLKNLASEGALNVAISSPSMSELLFKLIPQEHKADVDDKQLARYLKYKKFITSRISKNGDVEVSLTLGGWRRIQKFTMETMRIEAPGSWNEQWHLVMFDIPEQHKSARNAIVKHLKELGLSQWQRSVWVYPFECETEVMSIAQAYGVDQYVNYLVVKRSNRDHQLYRQFSAILP